MRKYDRTTIRNVYDKQKSKYAFTSYDPIRAECKRVSTLIEKMTEVYYRNPCLITEHHIVLNEFISTCTMASTNEPRKEPWILNNKERIILQFVRDNCPQEWQEYLNRGMFVNWLPGKIYGPIVIDSVD